MTKGSKGGGGSMGEMSFACTIGETSVGEMMLFNLIVERDKVVTFTCP